MITEVVVCGAAAALFGRGLYHSGVLTGWIVQGLSQGEPAPRNARERFIQEYRPNRQAEDRAWALQFIDVPSAFWLDPNLYGDDPDWRERLFSQPRQIDKLKAQVSDAGFVLYNPTATVRMVVNEDEPRNRFEHGACPACGAPCEQFTWHKRKYYSCTWKGCYQYERAWNAYNPGLRVNDRGHWEEIKPAVTDVDEALPAPPKSTD